MSLPTSLVIPATSFRKECQQYTKESGDRGVDACVWRELIQNARDAGASRIDIQFRYGGQRSILFRDNGRGMDRDTLVKGMLTFAGSVKEIGSAGGFGMAKLLLVFAPDHAIIRSRDNAVRIDGTSLTWLEVAEPINGTEFELAIDETEDRYLRVEPTAAGLRYTLDRCDLRGLEVYVDGKRWFDNPILPETGVMVREFENFKAKIYWFKGRKAPLNCYNQAVAVVLHRGIWVMDMPLPETANGHVIVDIDDEAKNVLAASRCSLSNYSHRANIEKFLTDMHQSPKAVLHPHRFVKRWEGKGLKMVDAAAHAKAVIEGKANRETKIPFNKLDPDDASRYLVEARLHLLTQAKAADTTAQYVEQPNELISLDRIPTDLDQEINHEAVAMLIWQAPMMVINERDKPVLDHYMPETMGPRVQRLLSAWCEAVRQFLLLNKVHTFFGVGYLFSNENNAYHRVEKDGSQWFLLNPNGQGEESNTVRFRMGDAESRAKLFVTAAHEVAHCVSGVDYHGDYFTNACDKNMEFLLNNSNIFNKIWKEAGRKIV